MSTIRLYTEEQVGKAIELAQKCEHDCGGVYFEYEVKDVLEELTPIELPSDEEISKYANFAMPDAEKIGGETYTAFKGFELGAKWMRDKIKGDK